MADPDRSNPKAKPLQDLDGGAPPAKGAPLERKSGVLPPLEKSTGKGAPLERKSGAIAPIPKTSTGAGGMPAVQLPAHGAAPAPGQTQPIPPLPKEQTAFIKSSLKSEFENPALKQKMASVIGHTVSKPMYEDDEQEEVTSLGKVYDGEAAPPELSNRDLWKAVQAPVQSREGRRSLELFKNVLAQFAVAKNPRYEPDGPDKPRGHIFIWDVSRAMNCEVPHFVGVKELTLAQTVDWMRHEGPMRGWLRANQDDAMAAALEGKLVVVVPKDSRNKQIAVLTPSEDVDANGKPYVMGAGKQRGVKLRFPEFFGANVVEYFVHP